MWRGYKEIILCKGLLQFFILKIHKKYSNFITHSWKVIGFGYVLYLIKFTAPQWKATLTFPFKLWPHNDICQEKPWDFEMGKID